MNYQKRCMMLKNLNFNHENILPAESMLEAATIRALNSARARMASDHLLNPSER
jgi:hypothetical protein